MPPSHPIDLPEILSTVAKHIPSRDLPACTRVSKAWYQAFISLTWRHITTRHPIPNESIHAHRHLVKTFKPLSTLPQECTAWRFPNLESLDIVFTHRTPGIYDFILEHPTLTSLTLCVSTNVCDPGPTFWKRLLGLVNLKDLTISSEYLTGKDMDAFWKLCTRLERLEVSVRELQPIGDAHSSVVFPHIKELDLESGYDDDLTYFEMVERCPSLKSIIFSQWDEDRGLSRFCQLVSKGTWPELESVSMHLISDVEISNYDFIRLIGNMKRITALIIPELQDTFGPECMDLLRPRLTHLKELDLTSEKGLTSPMVQEIMSSCPLLEVLLVHLVHAKDVVTGRPWVCTRLRELSVNLQFHPSKLHEHQPLVLDQLSRLTRLEQLSLDGYDQLPIEGFRETLDLRLEMGLQKLSTLRSLWYFSFYGTQQTMGQEEIEWIKNHWTSLEEFLGTVNYLKQELDTELRSQLEGYGIFVGTVDDD
ncbi:hypothetical protein B0O80DRAFT_532561 [Mortierella sp. GBAus27b]|nr:hypothetical protein BGX31_004459 [Mortierella sp. GBA43]KAI8348114.1 hypothetical protein B0O80DRAFT_532561 [Mortierella sp. GBAus27b]